MFLFEIVFLTASLLMEPIAAASGGAGTRISTSNDTLPLKTAQMEEVLIRSKPLSLLIRDLPYSVAVFSDTSFVGRANSGHQLPDLVKWVPGVQIEERGTAALGEQVIVRGGGWRSSFGVRGIQVLLNEIPLTSVDGQSVLTMINPAFIRSVDVSRGPASLLWGNGGRGLIHFDDRSRARDVPTRSRISYGSFGTLKYDLEVVQRSDAGSLQIQMGYMETEGYRNHSQATFYRTSMVGKLILTPKVFMESQFRLGGMPTAKHPGSLNKLEFTSDPLQARTPFVNADAGKLSTDLLGSTRFLMDLNPLLLSVSFYGATRQMDNPLPFGIIELERRSGGVRTTVEWSAGVWKHNAGLDVKTQHDSRKESENVSGEIGELQLRQKEHVLGTGFFARSRAEINSWGLDVGLRFDRNHFKVSQTLIPEEAYQRSFTSFSPVFAVSKQFGDIVAFGNVVSSFETPTFSELSNVTQLSAQGQLDPERSYGMEMGVKSVGGRRWTASATFFGVGTYDIILPVQLVQDGAVIFQNQGSTFHWGLETTGEVQLASWLYATSSVQISSIQFTTGELKGNKVPGIVPVDLKTRFSVIKGLLGVHFDAAARSKTQANNENTVWRDPYAVFDVSISTTKPLRPTPEFTIQPFVQVRNILDNAYSGTLSVNAFAGRVYEPSLPRGIFAGFEIGIL